ncbi:MAG TPA: peptidylprolyl isomerase [Flavobacteriales bacterium]|nr:peptidylprolyl isomerase [Flavobacteriales bacterium]HRE96588.1 peptidylprolyl isomerase [Flavobacteriales bacterium]HRJ35465.1 peptidylprolyl isomerase [Flavobacteriales bacterium]HRJ38836.1 peptidylprolyl isomerase [Flavobacteriales bacterium]
MLRIKRLFSVAGLFLTIQAAGQGKNIDRIIAVVGDRPILFSEVEMQRMQAVAQGLPFGPEKRGEILDEILFQNLLITHAELDSLTVSDAQVTNEMEGRLRYFEQQIGGRKKLEEFYGKSIAQIKEEFFDMIKDKLMAQAMERKITEGIKVTPNEVRAFYNRIPNDSLPLINSMVELAQLTIVPKVSDEEKKRTRIKLEAVRKRIMSGASTFCVEAIDSDDPGSNGNCGEWDFIPRGTFVPQFDAIAFRLKDGEFSEVFETDYGFHFMQLIQRRGDEYKGRHILFVPKISPLEMKASSLRLDSLYQAIRDGKISWEKACEKYSTDAESKRNGGRMMNPMNGDTKFDVADLDPQLFLTIDKMKPGQISLPVGYTTQDGKPGFRLLKLISRSAPHQANLTDDYQLIQNAAQNDKESKTVDDWARNKITSTYVWIADDFKQYTYRYNWIRHNN